MLDIPEERIDWRAKGFWLPDGSMTAAEVAAGRPGIFDGGFTWPLLVVRESAVRANIATMAAYAARHGMDFAPHAKTTMAPALLAAQLAAGAWGLTVATPNQALVLRKLGVPRVLIANEVLDPVGAALAGRADRRGLGGLLPGRLGRRRAGRGRGAGRDRRAAGAGRARVTRAGARVPYRRRSRRGGPRGRRRRPARAGRGHRLRGPAAPTRPRWTPSSTGWPTAVADAGRGRSAAGAADRVGRRQRVVRPGGRAARRRRAWVRLILRSGASVTHDDGFYREKTPFNRIPDEGPLVAAMEMWAQVISTPEPGLALVGMGKRDAPFDEGLPIVLAPAGLTVTKLNDHHTYLAVAGGVEVTPGDLLRFGLSHPCTAFDKWREIPVVDDDHRVVDVLHTYF